ncbi:MAG: RecQ family zinc-binding domain-containing protein, partial [Bdellovibrionales bacterium]
AENVHNLFMKRGRPALLYHGKMKAIERERARTEFQTRSPRLIIATSGYGSDLEKPDIRFVVHYNFPSSLETYYQELSQTGGDGKPARCVLLYVRRDKSIQALSLARKYPSLEELTTTYQILNSHAHDSGALQRKALEDETGLSLRKLHFLLGFLKHSGIVEEDGKGHFRVLKSELSTADLSALRSAFHRQEERDREKLKRVIVYSQSALCRWKLLENYFAEGVEWTNCGHCDNCQTVRRAIPAPVGLVKNSVSATSA